MVVVVETVKKTNTDNSVCELLGVGGKTQKQAQTKTMGERGKVPKEKCQAEP